MVQVPAGWYPDPQDATSKRYWDGTAWTAHRHPTQHPASSPKPDIARPAEQSTLKRWTRTLSPIGAGMVVLGSFLGRPVGQALFSLGVIVILVSLVLSIIRWTRPRT